MKWVFCYGTNKQTMPMSAILTWGLSTSDKSPFQIPLKASVFRNYTYPSPTFKPLDLWATRETEEWIGIGGTIVCWCWQLKDDCRKKENLSVWHVCSPSCFMVQTFVCPHRLRERTDDRGGHFSKNAASDFHKKISACVGAPAPRLHLSQLCFLCTSLCPQ